MKRMVQSDSNANPRRHANPHPHHTTPTSHRTPGPQTSGRHVFHRPKWISKSGRRVALARLSVHGDPATHLKKRLKQGDPGINRLKRMPNSTTSDYTRAKTLKDKYVADLKMIRAIGHLPGRKTLTEHVVRKSCKPRHVKSVKPFIFMKTIKKRKMTCLVCGLEFGTITKAFKEPRGISRSGVRFSINDAVRGPNGHRNHNRSRGSTGRLDGVSSPPSKSTTQGKGTTQVLQRTACYLWSWGKSFHK